MTEQTGCPCKWYEDCSICLPQKEAFNKEVFGSVKYCDHGWNGICFWCKSVKKTIREEIEK